MRIKLTAAQAAALQCRDGGGLGPVTDRAWAGRGNYLEFPKEDARELWDELNEASNGEDAHAEYGGGGRGARGAALALANLAGKCLFLAE